MADNKLKKDRHILINIDEIQYNQLTSIAEKHDRKISNLCYIIIKDYLIKEGLKYDR